MAANDYALVVGITKYPALGDLSGPENDARDFAAWLMESAGGNVPQANISLILSSDFPTPTSVNDAKPMLGEISMVLDSYFDRGSETGTAGRRLYLYYAGHGFAPDLEDAALFMANAANKRAYHVTGRPYANWFRKSGYFSEVVLFMDCCRDNYKRANPQLPIYDPSITATNPGERYFAFATKWSRKAREGPWGVGGTPRGIFTLALLDALRGAAPRDANGQVTGIDLESYVINSIRSNQKAFAAGEERPDPEFDFNHAVPFLFNPPPGEPPCNPPAPIMDGGFTMPKLSRYVVRLKPANGDGARTFELTAGDDSKIAEESRSATEWLWRLDTPGIYKVTRDDGASKIFEVIGEQEMIDVDI